jgi:uncharacterized membrane protein
MATTFSIGEAISMGWQKVKPQLLLVIGSMVFAGVISGILSLLYGSLLESNSTVANILGGILYIVYLIYSIVIGIGMTRLLLNIYDGKPASFNDVFTTYQPFWRYLGASILYAIIVMIGLVLLIVPGIFLAIKYQYVTYLIIDKNLSVKEAFKLSGEMTQGMKWKLFFFGIAAAIVGMAGIILIGVGLLFTIPIAAMAMVHVYRILGSPAPAAPTSAPAPQPTPTQA